MRTYGAGPVRSWSGEVGGYTCAYVGRAPVEGTSTRSGTGTHAGSGSGEAATSRTEPSAVSTSTTVHGCPGPPASPSTRGPAALSAGSQVAYGVGTGRTEPSGDSTDSVLVDRPCSTATSPPGSEACDR